MLRRTLLTIAFIAAASPAWAGSTSTSTSDADAIAKAKAAATATLQAEIAVKGGNTDFHGSAGSYALPSPASGPCTGASGGFAFNSVLGGGGVSIGTVETNCRKDEHIRIGLSDPATAPQARKDWFTMDADLFGHANTDPTAPQTSSTSATPAAIQPEQTAALPRCANDALSTAAKMAIGCQ